LRACPQAHFYSHKNIKTYLSRPKKGTLEVFLALHCPGVETYLHTEKKHSFTHNFSPAIQLSPLCVGSLVGFHVGCCVVVSPPSLAPLCPRHRRHRRWSANRMTPATRAPTAAPTWVWSSPPPPKAARRQRGWRASEGRGDKEGDYDSNEGGKQ
jgi:hypothetical protein